MKEFFTVPYVDDNSDNQSRFQRAVLRTETPLHIQPFFAADPAMTYLQGDAPFQNRKIHPFPVFLLCSDDLRDSESSEFVTRVRTISKCADLPIIMLGESGKVTSVSKCYAAGADHFVDNPWAAARLDMLVQTLYDCAALGPPGFDSLSSVREHQACPRACAAR